MAALVETYSHWKLSFHDANFVVTGGTTGCQFMTTCGATSDDKLSVSSDTSQWCTWLMFYFFGFGLLAVYLAIFFSIPHWHLSSHIGRYDCPSVSKEALMYISEFNTGIQSKLKTWLQQKAKKYIYSMRFIIHLIADDGESYFITDTVMYACNPS